MFSWLIKLIFWLYWLYRVLILWSISDKEVLFQVHYGDRAVWRILVQGMVGWMFLVDDRRHALVPSLFLYLWNYISFSNCRPTDGSSYPPKLRRHASASANISNLISQNTSANPGFPKKINLLKIPD